ncbi:hypothetical protein Rsub_12077 [Raphidocelis subcapitata]|uniref:Uncharacterized protein n=1 Tax=Raphidocelis subcapitata TaxID=307507 RepID=A0A2V0PHR3_9CHLO|nr:hypothetical protein Rsub_12077 [Raphidocelis subcapitata]|eukprot:GBF99296.1 hypothetical protein Rsub_12077 [Raphidocelis subcapitata]
MGAELSLPEQLYSATKRDDVPWLQEALHQWQQQRRRASGAAARNSVLSWQDPTSRLTPLMLAAARGRPEIAKALLDAGADPNFLCRAPQRGPRRGTALHEAACARQAGMVELLVQRGADPFMENADGYTAMEVAASEGDAPMLRSMEARALFAGYVAQRVTGDDAGVTAGDAFLVRWCVVAPRLAPPAPGQGAAGVVRAVLYSYDEWGDAQPATQAWLDGAATSLSRAGEPEGRVRLHPLHAEPPNAGAARAGGCWELAFRPAGASPLAAAALSALIDCCGRPLDYLAAAPAAGAAPARPWGWPAGGAPDGGEGAAAEAAAEPGPGEGRAAGPQVANDMGQCASQLRECRMEIQQQLGLLQQLQARQAALQQHLHDQERALLPPPAHRGALSRAVGGRTLQLVAAAAPPPAHAEPLVPLAAAAAAAATAVRSSIDAPPAVDAGGGAAAAATAADGCPEAEPLAPGQWPMGADEGSPAAAALEPEACVVCLSAPRAVGFLHGASVHKCVCAPCAARVRTRGGGCPICRQPIAATLAIY